MEYLQYIPVQTFIDFIISFKPCYKWNTFNTPIERIKQAVEEVLNLVINGIPSIL